MRFKDSSIVSKENSLYPWLILTIVTVLTMVGAANATTVGIADPVIQGQFAVGDTAMMWVSIIYLLALATGVPLAARLSLRIGRKKTLFFSSALFFLFSILSGAAVDYYSLLIPRFISGVGAGVFFPMCVAVLPLYFPKERLTLAIALYSGIGFGLGIALGVLFGGIVAQAGYWRELFFINIPFAILILAAIWLFFEESEVKKDMPRFDFAGYFLFLFTAFSLIILIYNVKQPWNTEGWHSLFTLGMIALSFCFMTSFIIVENKKKEPLFLLKHFRIVSFTLACLGIFLVGTYLFGNISTFRTILNDLLEYDKIQTGKHLFYYGIFIGIGAFACGMLSYVVNERRLCFVGLALIAISSFINHSFTYMADHTDIIVLFLVRGLGVGFALGPVLSLGILRIPPEEIPKAVILLVILRQLGGAFGNGIIELVRAMRLPYHLEIFGTFMHESAPRMQEVMRQIVTRLTSVTGMTKAEAKEAADLTLIKITGIQAQIASYNDSFFILGIAVSAIFTIFMIRIVYLKIIPKKQ